MPKIPLCIWFWLLLVRLLSVDLLEIVKRGEKAWKCDETRNYYNVSIKWALQVYVRLLLLIFFYITFRMRDEYSKNFKHLHRCMHFRTFVGVTEIGQILLNIEDIYQKDLYDRKCLHWFYHDFIVNQSNLAFQRVGNNYPRYHHK
jgi:hypothetical protein